MQKWQQLLGNISQSVLEIWFNMDSDMMSGRTAWFPSLAVSRKEVTWPFKTCTPGNSYWNITRWKTGRGTTVALRKNCLRASTWIWILKEEFRPNRWDCGNIILIFYWQNWKLQKHVFLAGSVNYYWKHHCLPYALQTRIWFPFQGIYMRSFEVRNIFKLQYKKLTFLSSVYDDD